MTGPSAGGSAHNATVRTQPRIRTPEPPTSDTAEPQAQQPDSEIKE